MSNITMNMNGVEINDGRNSWSKLLFPLHSLCWELNPAHPCCNLNSGSKFLERPRYNPQAGKYTWRNHVAILILGIITGRPRLQFYRWKTVLAQPLLQS